jgi:hypothetical protein
MDALPPPSPVTAQCLWDAAVKERIPIEVLVAVLRTEGGSPGLRKRNANGTEDLGPFQINSMHVRDPLTKYMVTNHGCYNALSAAYRLRIEIDRAGDFWTGVGNYHSHTPKYHRHYLQLIVRALQETSDYSRRMREIFEVSPQVTATDPAGGNWLTR